ncbi:MAG: dephospho-CoA kinase [Deltaproteobacteria bacterium]|jgi:dephospho-CoA kinase|nr:dephospho-CoA kinase [Deltaproteobacteria bacterium]
MSKLPQKPRLIARQPNAPPPPWAVDPDGLLKTRPGSIKAALTGGIASGKSSVAELFVAFGAGRVDFDALSKKILAPDSPYLAAAAALFGPKAIKDGSLDRRYVGKKVFKDPKLRKALEDIVHPAVWSLMLDELKSAESRGLTIIEVPLLYEAALDSLFEPVIVCFAKPETQLKRLRERNPELGRFEARRRLKAQIPIFEKIRRANIVINNDDDLPRLIASTRQAWEYLFPDKGVPVQ